MKIFNGLVQNIDDLVKEKTHKKLIREEDFLEIQKIVIDSTDNEINIRISRRFKNGN